MLSKNVVPCGKLLLIYLVYLVIYRLYLSNKFVIFVCNKRGYLRNGDIYPCQCVIMHKHGDSFFIFVPVFVQLVGKLQCSFGIAAFIHPLDFLDTSLEFVVLIVENKQGAYGIYQYRRDQYCGYLNSFQLPSPPYSLLRVPFL